MIPSILDDAKDVDTLKKYVQYLSQQVDTLLNNSALKPGDLCGRRKVVELMDRSRELSSASATNGVAILPSRYENNPGR